MCVREKRDVSSEPDVHQKKEASFKQQSDFILLSLAAPSEHEWNKTPADTTVTSAKEEMTTDLHFHPSKHGPSMSSTN